MLKDLLRFFKADPAPPLTNLEVRFNLERNWTARERFRLRVIGREHPELTLSFNTVRCEVCVINGKNY